jgi:aminoglycoside phosphotransferase (APT) family kinase protein
MLPPQASGRRSPATASAHTRQSPGEIVSHGDLGPWNTVYRHGAPVGFIDWDAAQPVEPLADLAAAAWTFVPLALPRQLAEARSYPRLRTAW